MLLNFPSKQTDADTLDNSDDAPLLMMGQTRIEFENASRVADAEFHQLNQLLEIQNNLVSIYVVLETYKDKPEKLGGVLDLVNRGDGAAMALIGKDVEDELPEAKDYPVVVALESAGERVKKIIQAIITAIKKVIKSIAELFKKISKMLNSDQKAFRALERKFKGNVDITGTDTQIPELHFSREIYEYGTKDKGYSLSAYLEKEKEYTKGALEQMQEGLAAMQTATSTDTISEWAFGDANALREADAKQERPVRLSGTTPADLGIVNVEEAQEVIQQAGVFLDDTKKFANLAKKTEKVLQKLVDDLEKSMAKDDEQRPVRNTIQKRNEFIQAYYQYINGIVRDRGIIFASIVKVLSTVEPVKA